MSLHVRVLYFGGFTGTKEEALTVGNGATVSTLLNELGARYWISTARSSTRR